MKYKFRGKRVDNNEWVYGYLYKSEKTTLIVYDWNEYYSFSYSMFFFYEVDSRTVGMWTGLEDKNGEEIYEGDIIDVYLPPKWDATEVKIVRGVVRYREETASYVITTYLSVDDYRNGEIYYEYNFDDFRIEKKGNVFDNIDLLNDKIIRFENR